MRCDWRVRKPCAAACGRYPRSSIAASTRARVAGLTRPWWPLITLETVLMETPTRSATSLSRAAMSGTGERVRTLSHRHGDAPFQAHLEHMAAHLTLYLVHIGRRLNHRES